MARQRADSLEKKNPKILINVGFSLSPFCFGFMSSNLNLQSGIKCSPSFSIQRNQEAAWF